MSRFLITIGPPPAPPFLSVGEILLTGGTWYVKPAWSLVFEVNFYAAVTAIILLAPEYVMETIILGSIILAVFDVSGVQRLPGIFGSDLTLEFGFGVIVAYITRRGMTGLAPSSSPVTSRE